ncbi:MAG: hypothetical protein WBP44_11705, partial [Gammaproteobacteria bacterium]
MRTGVLSGSSAGTDITEIIELNCCEHGTRADRSPVSMNQRHGFIEIRRFWNKAFCELTEHPKGTSDVS